MGTRRPRPVRAGVTRVSRRSGRCPGALQSRRLQVDPTSGFRNYRAAHATFSRLLTDFPKSRWEADARAWRATLSDLLAREEEAARLKPQVQSREEEATRLRLQLRWREEETARLKSQLQVSEQETSSLKAQIQHLRRVDLNLERRR